MTQWMLLCGTTTAAVVATSASATALTTRVRALPGSAQWLRRYSSIPDRRKRNHFKPNRKHDNNNNNNSNGDDKTRAGSTKLSNWSLFDSAGGSGGNGGRAGTGAGRQQPHQQQQHGGRFSDNNNGSVKKRPAFGRRKPVGGESTMFTNKFQNLLSFSINDEDEKDTTTQASTAPKDAASSDLLAKLAGRRANNAAKTIPAGDGRARIEDEDDEADDDMDDDAQSLFAKQKKTKPKTETDAKKIKDAKKHKKKDGRSLLQNFKFETSIFGDDDDFFGHVDWSERDSGANREERRSQRQLRKNDKDRRRQQQTPVKVTPQEVEIPTQISVKDLAERMAIKSKVLLKALRELGERGLDDDSVITNDVAEVAVESLNMIPVLLPPEFIDVEFTIPPEDCSMFPQRPPVVSVMGHVDHGKTTLLDALRRSKVAASEAGGITQSIGAFMVDLGKQFGKLGTMTFIDTPGHAAFSSMRSMGSEVTDMIVLVVAADDGVRPQTVEVIELAQKNNVPLVIAVTKVDMHAHDQDEVLERIAGELLARGVVVESMGGDTPVVCVSGKTGDGLDTLKETIALHAEVLDLRADVAVKGEAVVLEASTARGVGAQVDTIVKWGTLKVGAMVVCGLEYGKIKALVGPDGKRVKEARPGTPVRVIGLKGLPNAGEALLTVENEERAKEVVKGREEIIEWDLLAAAEESTVDGDADSIMQLRRRRYMGAHAKSRELEMRRRQFEDEAKRVASLKVGDDGYVAKVVPIIVKTDSMGVISAIDELIASLPSEEASIKRIIGAVGPVTSSDLALAEATGARIYEFNVRHSSSIAQEALQKNVSIHQHRVIYSLLDDISELLQENLEGVEQIEVVGAAEIVQAIPINARGRRTVHIAGCRVTQGSLTMQAKYRIVRDGEIVREDISMETMRHFQEKVSEVTKGQECGLQLAHVDEFQPGDILEAYTVKHVKKHIHQ